MSDPRFAAPPDPSRFGDSGIGERASGRWPNGNRLASYLGFNLEHFAFGECLGATLAPASSLPDVLNFAWREYGSRVAGRDHRGRRCRTHALARRPRPR